MPLPAWMVCNMRSLLQAASSMAAHVSKSQVDVMGGQGLAHCLKPLNSGPLLHTTTADTQS
jgi:hypothetical protein